MCGLASCFPDGALVCPYFSIALRYFANSFIFREVFGGAGRPESWQSAADRKSAKLLKATQHAPDIGRVAGAQRVHMSVA